MWHITRPLKQLAEEKREPHFWNHMWYWWKRKPDPDHSWRKVRHRQEHTRHILIHLFSLARKESLHGIQFVHVSKISKILGICNHQFTLHITWHQVRSFVCCKDLSWQCLARTSSYPQALQWTRRVCCSAYMVWLFRYYLNQRKTDQSKEAPFIIAEVIVGGANSHCYDSP